VGWRRGVVAAIALLALVLAGAALAGNGGIAPPSPKSPNAQRITDSYWLILGVTGAIFVLVEGALVAFVVKYRNRGRPRTAEGPQIIGHSRLELIWTLIPVLILAGIASFVFYKLPGIQHVPAAKAQGGPLRIQVVAHQFYWEFRYPNGAISIDELHAPVHEVVRVDIHSRDVDHSWWIPELHGKFDAIPGEVNHTWFRAKETGTYLGQCGEFCGIFHAKMSARVLVESRGEYDRFISATAKRRLGRSLFRGACAKCHGFTGKGDYGPSIAGSATASSPDQLAQLVRNGRDTPAMPGVMPPVGRGWTKSELDALVKYVQENVSGG
jgi:cytochrome c oxidase subunit 2